MKGCTDYTEEARNWANWVKPSQGKWGAKRSLIILLLACLAIIVAVAFWPRQSEEGFTVASASEKQESKGEGASLGQPEPVVAPFSEPEEKGSVIVYITGAVQNPGVYELSKDDRLNDLIQMAGGLVEGSAINYINLAATLQDGTHIHIPFLSEIESGEAALILANGALDSTEAQSPTSNGGSQQSQLVNINAADTAELMTLPGIGAVTAQRIIDYREKYGAFRYIDDLKKVSGIGDKKYADLVDKVCL